MDSTGLKECSKCKNLVPDSESICDQCGSDEFSISDATKKPAAVNHTNKSKTTAKKRIPSKKELFIRNIVAGAVLVILITGKYHFVHGSTYTGDFIISKVSFSFSETFINTDQIMNVPVIAAKSNWPLAVAALQKEGFLESDTNREKRIKAEVEAEFRKNQAEAEEAEKQARRDLYKLENGKYPD